MKITKKQLKRIIQEEIGRALEGSYRGASKMPEDKELANYKRALSDFYDGVFDEGFVSDPPFARTEVQSYLDYVDGIRKFSQIDPEPATEFLWKLNKWMMKWEDRVNDRYDSLSTEHEDKMEERLNFEADYVDPLNHAVLKLGRLRAYGSMEPR